MHESMYCLKLFVPLMLALFTTVESNIHLSWVNRTYPLLNSLSMIVKHNFIENGSGLLFYAYTDDAESRLLHAGNDFFDVVLRNVTNATYKVVFQRQKNFENLQHNEVVLLADFKTFR